MPKKKYIVTLTDEERTVLEELVNKEKNPAYKVLDSNKFFWRCSKTPRSLLS